MTHLQHLVTAILLCVCCTLQAKNKVVDQPPFIVRNTTSIEVSKVILGDTATVLHIYAKYRPKYWIQIAPESYLKDNNGETYQLRSGIGITPGEKFWMPESGEAEFQLVFPALPDNVTSIDFTEGEKVENGFSIWGIQLKNKKLPELILPKEVVVHKTDAVADLPEPTIQYAKATLKGKLLDFRPNMGISAQLLAWDNIKADYIQVSPDIQPDGSFMQEVMLACTTPCSMSIGIGTVKFFLEPGKTTELYVNMRELSRLHSKYHSNSKPYGEVAYVNGPLQTVTQELNRQWSDINIQSKLYNDLNAFADKDINSTKAYILKTSDEMQIAIDKLPCSKATRQLLTLDNKLSTCNMLANVPSLLTSSAIKAGSLKREEANEYYIKLRQQIPADYLPDADLAILNTPQAILSSEYISLIYATSDKRTELAQAWGVDKGIFFDVLHISALAHSIKDFTPLTDEQKAEIATMPAPYREMLTAANDELLAQIEANKKKTGYTVNQVDENMANDKLFDSIISRYKGKVILVDFWATWCGPCRMANKAMVPMKEELKDKNIVYLYLTGETSPLKTWENMIPDIHGEHFRVTAAQWAFLSENFKIEGVPTYMVIDKEGNTQFRSTGFPGVEKMKTELLKLTGM